MSTTERRRVSGHRGQRVHRPLRGGGARRRRATPMVEPTGWVRRNRPARTEPMRSRAIAFDDVLHLAAISFVGHEDAGAVLPRQHRGHHQPARGARGSEPTGRSGAWCWRAAPTSTATTRSRRSTEDALARAGQPLRRQQGGDGADGAASWASACRSSIARPFNYTGVGPAGPFPGAQDCRAFPSPGAGNRARQHRCHARFLGRARRGGDLCRPAVRVAGNGGQHLLGHRSLAPLDHRALCARPPGMTSQIAVNPAFVRDRRDPRTGGLRRPPIQRW